MPPRRGDPFSFQGADASAGRRDSTPSAERHADASFQSAVSPSNGFVAFLRVLAHPAKPASQRALQSLTRPCVSQTRMDPSPCKPL